MQSLSGRELEVLQILWNNEKPMAASQVYSVNPKLSINTIHSVLKTLLKKDYIEVADIVYSGTVLTRSYRPSVKKVDYIKDNFFMDTTINAIVAAFIEQENNQAVLDQLEDMIQKKRDELR